MISDTNRARGTLCSTERGQKGGKEKKQMDRHTEEREKDRQTVHTKDCLGGIWWTDVCVCELMEESSSLRGAKLAFAHKEKSL